MLSANAISALPRWQASCAILMQGKPNMTRHFADRSVRLNTGELLDINDGEDSR
jgi:hypothetical protein